MAENNKQLKLRIKKLKLKNFKCFEDFEIEFPEPKLPGSPNATVIGSKNGVGKTSILEAIALSLLSFFYYSFNNPIINKIWFSIINANALHLINNAKHSASVSIDLKFGSVKPIEPYFSFDIPIKNVEDAVMTSSNLTFSNLIGLDPENNFESILGINTEPVLISQLFHFFHSYRKIQQGLLIDESSNENGRYFQRWIMDLKKEQASIRKPGNPADAKRKLERIDGLLNKYAGFRISHFEGMDNGELLMVEDENNKSMPFDSLSSGQKEMISILSMLAMNDSHGICLIDEPELHLNADWHANFLYTASKYAPNVQFIVATHSTSLFGSVPKEQRIFLKDK